MDEGLQDILDLIAKSNDKIDLHACSLYGFDWIDTEAVLSELSDELEWTANRCRGIDDFFGIVESNESRDVDNITDKPYPELEGKKETPQINQPPIGQNKQFKCGVLGCVASFTLKRSLDRHFAALYNRIREVACPHCPATFYERGNRAKHIATIHVQNDPARTYFCSQCPSSFKRRADLRGHVNKLHM